jgi:hypothetical protein
MTIENGTAIVLAYVLVSMGVVIAFLLAAFVIGWFIADMPAILLAQTNDRRARAAREQAAAGLPCASGDELVSLGFRVGNLSAIGWHQPRIFQHPCYP